MIDSSRPCRSSSVAGKLQKGFYPEGRTHSRSDHPAEEVSHHQAVSLHNVS